MKDARTIALYQNITENGAMVRETPDRNEISKTKYFYNELINTFSTSMNIKKLKNHMSGNLILEESTRNIFS